MTRRGGRSRCTRDSLIPITPYASPIRKRVQRVFFRASHPLGRRRGPRYLALLDQHPRHRRDPQEARGRSCGGGNRPAEARDRGPPRRTWPPESATESESPLLWRARTTGQCLRRAGARSRRSCSRSASRRRSTPRFAISPTTRPRSVRGEGAGSRRRLASTRARANATAG